MAIILKKNILKMDNMIAQLVYFQSFDAYLVQYGQNGNGFTDTCNHDWYLNQKDALNRFYKL